MKKYGHSLTFSWIEIEDLCLIDSATIQTNFKNRKYFSQLIIGENYVNTIFGSPKLIECFKRTIIILLEVTRFIINNTLFSSKFQRYLL